MKKFDKSIILYIIIGIVMLLIKNLTLRYLYSYSRLINLIIWGIIFAIIQFKKTELRRYQNVDDKLIYIILIMIGYYVAYFALGFFYGYSNNPYSQKIGALLKNIVFIIGVSLLQEYTRCKLLNSTRGISSNIIITILFVLFSIEFTNFPYYFKNTQTTLEYIFGELSVIIISSAVLTYLTLQGGIKLSFTYAITSKLGLLLMPILPDLNWFVECVLEIVTALILIVAIYYLHNYRNKAIERREFVKSNPASTLLSIILLTIFALFIAGILPYKPVAVMSNSMVPIFARGDIIIVKEFEKDDVEELKEGTIVEYKIASGSSIVHRITKIEQSENGLLFTTKGDNNVSEDSDKVKLSQIKGIVTMSIPYVGFPSVYFSQFVLNVSPTINT